MSQKATYKELEELIKERNAQLTKTNEQLRLEIIERKQIEAALIKSEQKHPEIGYNILKSIKFPWPVAQIVLQHHERMDGSGYPKGLSGEDILLEAESWV